MSNTPNLCQINVKSQTRKGKVSPTLDTNSAQDGFLTILVRSVVHSTLFNCIDFGESGESGEPSDSGEPGESNNSSDSVESGNSGESGDSGISSDSGKSGGNCEFHI